jgi:hypothetical protein
LLVVWSADFTEVSLVERAGLSHVYLGLMLRSLAAFALRGVSKHEAARIRAAASFETARLTRCASSVEPRSVLLGTEITPVER